MTENKNENQTEETTEITKNTDKPKKHVKISLKNTILISLTSVLVGVFLTLGIVTLLEKQNPVDPDIQEISQVYDKLEKTYYKNVSADTLKNGAISGMLSSLNDPYSTYLDDDQSQQINSTIQGSNFSGIGVQVVSKNNQVVIDSLIAGSPAKKANLKAGDIIKAVDKTELKDGDISKASELIRGKINTTVTLTIVRANKEMTFKIKRAKIAQSTVTYSKYDAQTVLLQISQFDVNTAKDLKKSLKQIEKDKFTKVIIDVRSNPGGVMDAAIQSASYFVKNGKVLMQYQEKGQKAIKIKSSKKYNDGYQTKLKATVLVDTNTASAGEIFAAALNQSSGVSLVGQKTYGKGTVQEVNQVSSKAEYKYTVAKWLTPNGTWVNEKGITPTVTVKIPAYLNLSSFTEATPLKSGIMGLDVAVLQQYLLALGYLQNHLTGIYDTQTLTAVKNFQAAQKLPVTGIVTDTERNALYQAIIKKAQAEDQTLEIARKELDK